MSINTYSTTQQFITGKSMATMSIFQAVKSLPVNWLENSCSCPCNCVCFDEYVFHDSDGTDQYKNDKRSRIFLKDFDGDGYDLKLYKSTAPFTPIDIDTAIATVYGFGDIEGDTDELYEGFIIDWYLVYTLHGDGDYIIKGTVTRQGIDYISESWCYKLRPFSCDIAKDTIKIESIMNGLIQSEDIDLTGMNWYSAIRVHGKLSKLTPKMQTESFITGGRVLEEIQSQIFDEWQLELWPMPAVVSNMIVYNFTLSNEVKISDYNIAPEMYSQIELSCKDIALMKTWANNPAVRVTLKLEDRLQNKLKRNFA